MRGSTGAVPAAGLRHGSLHRGPRRSRRTAPGRARPARRSGRVRPRGDEQLQGRPPRPRRPSTRYAAAVSPAPTLTVTSPAAGSSASKASLVGDVVAEVERGSGAAQAARRSTRAVPLSVASTASSTTCLPGMTWTPAWRGGTAAASSSAAAARRRVQAAGVHRHGRPACARCGPPGAGPRAPRPRRSAATAAPPAPGVSSGASSVVVQAGARAPWLPTRTIGSCGPTPVEPAQGRRRRGRTPAATVTPGSAAAARSASMPPRWRGPSSGR